MDSNEPEATPPAYEGRHMNAQQPHQGVPPPATNGRSYFENGAEANITLHLCPDVAEHYSTQAWCAQLDMKCDNVPQLMLGGLYWTIDNVLWEDGYVADISAAHVDITTFEELYRAGRAYTRHYFLRDMEQEHPKWIAHLQVHAEAFRTLGGINLGELSMQNVWSAYAWGSRGELIYGWSKKKPWNAFNAIYDDMPMGGWWPWPKGEDV
ncbi:hypothetical protein F4814DRAFT_451235 [Daldinia grandis]|nr:hypothetical protein F4814DRAFT_451235 [Daldinia grandis]